MLIINIPPELIYIIIRFLTIRDIRVLNKIRAFKNYRPIFQNFINKNKKDEIEFINAQHLENIKKNLQYDVKKLKFGLTFNSERLGAYILNIYRDKLEKYEILLNNIENESNNEKQTDVSKLYKIYLKFIKIMIEKYGHGVTSHFISPFKFRPNTNDMLNFRINNIIRENRKYPSY